MTDKIRIGFVGVGSMGQCAHLKNYVINPECEVAAIAELRPDLRAKVAARYGIPRSYPDHEAMLSNEKLDAIVASQPFMRHGAMVPELAKAGIPIFTEKPLAASIEMGEKIIAALKRHHTWQMVGYHKRSDPAVMYARVEIEKFKETGELGKTRYLRVLMPSGDWIANGFSDLIRTDEKTPPLQWDPAPAGMDDKAVKRYISFVNYYIHPVNLMRHLLGEPYAIKYADSSGVIAAFESASGIPCLMEMSPYRASLDWPESVLVAFERGFIKLDLPAPLASNRPGRVEVFKDPGNGVTPETIVPQLPWVHAMRQQATHFIKAVKGEMKPLCGAEEALEDLKVARDYMRLRYGD